MQASSRSKLGRYRTNEPLRDFNESQFCFVCLFFLDIAQRLLLLDKIIVIVIVVVGVLIEHLQQIARTVVVGDQPIGFARVDVEFEHRRALPGALKVETILADVLRRFPAQLPPQRLEFRDARLEHAVGRDGHCFLDAARRVAVDAECRRDDDAAIDVEIEPEVGDVGELVLVFDDDRRAVFACLRDDVDQHTRRVSRAAEQLLRPARRFVRAAGVLVDHSLFRLLCSG